jgi:hypothetical protein
MLWLSSTWGRADRLSAQLFRVNGTAVPYDITLRPYDYSVLSPNLYPLATGQFKQHRPSSRLTVQCLRLQSNLGDFWPKHLDS